MREAVLDQEKRSPMLFDQIESDVRFEWGLSGLQALAPVSDVVIIVDVLSFTTCVEIAVANGAAIYPYAGSADGLAAYAKSIGALAASRRKLNQPTYSLAPSSLTTIPAGTRLVLPSPNGSTLSLAAPGKPVLAGCLRNARAAAEQAHRLGKSMCIIAAGERWPDGLLRPALEDQLGAGAIITHLPGTRSPEAELAAAAFQYAKTNLFDTLLRCSSGKELVEIGFGEDVRLASELNISDCSPVLVNGAYTNLPE
jgi:2-phosphosulfolactate phosphatase